MKELPPHKPLPLLSSEGSAVDDSSSFNSLQKRRPYSEKTGRAAISPSQPLFPPLAKPQNVSAEKTPFLSCGSPKTMPGHGPLEQTDSSEKCRAAFQKNSGSASKKDGGERTVFRNNDALGIRCKHLSTGAGVKRKKGCLKKRPLNDERLLISGAFPKITLASAYFPT